MSSPLFKTVRSDTVKGVIRLRRMNPLAPPATSQTAETSTHQNTCRRRNMAGTRVIITIITFTTRASGSLVRNSTREPKPSVNVL